MENNIKLSILMPSLNVAEYIGQSLESAINQTIDCMEILCIDAGSSDGTIEIIKAYAENNPNIRILRSDQKSYGHQMNIGLQAARGEYIGIIETDDYVDEDMFEILYKAAKSCDADVVKGVLYEVYEGWDGDSREIRINYIPTEKRTGISFSPEDDPSVHKWDGNIWNGIYKKSFLFQHDICFNETPGAAFQDIGFQQMVLNEADCVLFLDNYFYHYRKVRIGSSTWNPKCLRYIYQEYKRLFNEGRLKDSHRRWVYARMVPAFLDEYEKALSYSDFDESDLECPEAIEWLMEITTCGIKQGYFYPEDVMEMHRKRVYDFLIDRDRYIENYKCRIEKISRWFYGLIDKIRDGKLVIFGAGKYGKMLALFLLRNGFLIEGMTDNNVWLHNMVFYGWSVKSIDDAIRCWDGCYFMIANKESSSSIKGQLLQKGIPDERIILFDGSDSVVLEEIRKQTILVRNK